MLAVLGLSKVVVNALESCGRLFLTSYRRVVVAFTLFKDGGKSKQNPQLRREGDFACARVWVVVLSQFNDHEMFSPVEMVWDDVGAYGFPSGSVHTFYVWQSVASEICCSKEGPSHTSLSKHSTMGS